MFFIDFVELDDVVYSPQDQVSVVRYMVDRKIQHRCCKNDMRRIPLAKSEKRKHPTKTKKQKAEEHPTKDEKAKNEISVVVVPIPGVEPGSTRIIANESIESG